METQRSKGRLWASEFDKGGPPKFHVKLQESIFIGVRGAPMKLGPREELAVRASLKNDKPPVAK